MTSERGKALLSLLELKRFWLSNNRGYEVEKPLIVSDEEYFEIIREKKRELNKKKTK